jgi:outer membrane lipoprotein-sorting protein
MDSTKPGRAATAGLVAFLFSAGANAAASPPSTSALLTPPADQQADFVLSEEGVQVYTCKQSSEDPGKFRWSFVAPDGTLKDNGASVGHHSGGTWESTTDRSSVTGTVRSSQDGGSGNIPWLLLSAKSNDATGMFSGVTSIQRVSTRGGVEPTYACDNSTLGKEERVAYTADYYFYKKK